jgi:hypothetical protein
VIVYMNGSRLFSGDAGVESWLKQRLPFRRFSVAFSQSHVANPGTVPLYCFLPNSYITLPSHESRKWEYFGELSVQIDRLCGLVVRALGYRFGGPGSIPGTTRKKSSGSGTGSTQPREYN